MKLWPTSFVGSFQSAALVLTLATVCLLTSGCQATSNSGEAYDAAAGGARFISARAARAAAARSAAAAIPEEGASRLTVRAARAAAARAARAAAASSGPAARPAAYYPGMIEEDGGSPDLYWAALDAHSAAGADVVPVYKWANFESRAARSQTGQPKRAGTNRKFQTQGW